MTESPCPNTLLDDLVELRLEKSNGVKDPRRPYIGLEHIAQGRPRLLGWLPSEASVSINCLFEADDILFGKLRPNLRKSLRAPFPGYCSTDILVLRAKEGVDPGFAGHVFQWERVFNAASATAAGTKMPRTSWKALRRYSVYLPDSTDNQQRIAVVLDLVDAAIAKTEAVIAKLKCIRAGLLHDLLTCGLDANGQLRDPLLHPELFKPSPLGRIPKEWEVDSLVSRISLPEGQVDPKTKPYCDWILVAPDHIESETGRLISLQTAGGQGAISGKYVFHPNDVLYSKIRPYLCKAVLADEQGLCSADMYPLRPNEGVAPQFLLAVVLGSAFTRFASAVSMRSGFPKINRTELAEYRMAWPPSDEQVRMSDLIKASDQRELSVTREKSKLTQLKAGLMSDLLSGRVHVPEGD